VICTGSMRLGWSGWRWCWLVISRAPRMSFRSGRQVKVLHRWSGASQPSPLVIDPAGGYALVPITAGPARRHCPRSPRATIAWWSGRTALLCANRPPPPRTSFVSINLASGTATSRSARPGRPSGRWPPGDTQYQADRPEVTRQAPEVNRKPSPRRTAAAKAAGPDWWEQDIKPVAAGADKEARQ
jgi:hypothetical protein